MQTSYKFEMNPALVGQLADLTNHTIDSFAVEGSLNPGEVVERGTDADKQVKVLATAANAIGVAMHAHKEVYGDSYYSENDSVGVVTKGRVWVNVDGAVKAGASAKYVVADKVFSATNGVALGVTAKFITSTDDAGLAVVEIG